MAISYLTGIKLTPSRRNHRKQDFHLEMARAVHDVHQKRLGKKWDDNRNKNGRSTKAALINDYVASHPDATASEVAEVCGVSRPTAYKYMPNQECKPRGRLRMPR